jgi:hypothetical protein
LKEHAWIRLRGVADRLSALDLQRRLAGERARIARWRMRAVPRSDDKCLSERFRQWNTAGDNAGVHQSARLEFLVTFSPEDEMALIAFLRSLVAWEVSRVPIS